MVMLQSSSVVFLPWLRGTEKAYKALTFGRIAVVRRQRGVQSPHSSSTKRSLSGSTAAATTITRQAALANYSMLKYMVPQ